MPSVEELETYTKLSAGDGMCGVAISPKGDIACLYKNPSLKNKGVVSDLLLTAREYGGTKLICSGQALVNMYEECGFEPVARAQFDPAFEHEDCVFSKVLDLFFLKATDEDTLSVIEKFERKDFSYSSQEELMKLPIMSYEEAYEYREGMLKND